MYNTDQNRLSRCTDGRRCLLGSHLIPVLVCGLFLHDFTRKIRVGSKERGGPHLPTSAPTVLSLQPLYRQSRQEQPLSGKAAVAIMCRADRRHKGHLVSKCGPKTTLQQNLLGELLKIPITRLGYSSGVQHWPNMYEVLSSVPSMGRGEGEHPTPIPKDLSQLMTCLYSAVGKLLHFRPNIKTESALLSPRDLTHWSGHSQTGLQKPCLESGLRPTCPTAFRAQIR